MLVSSPPCGLAVAIFIVDAPLHCSTLFFSFINLYLIRYISKMMSVPPIDITVRKTGRPRIYTEEEIKERRREQMRQYLTKKKESKVNKPKSTIIGCPRIYANEEAKQKKRESIRRYYQKNRERCIERSKRCQLCCKAEALKQEATSC